MIARKIGEGARRETHAVKSLLIEAVRRGLQREMSHPRLGEPVKRLMQRDRVRRGQSSVCGERARHDADSADRRRFPAERSPYLAHKGGDGGFPAGPGHCDYGLGLTGIESRRSMRERRARVGHLDEGRIRKLRLTLRDDHSRPLRRRLGGMPEAVVPRAREGEEYVALLHLAAVASNSSDLAGRKRTVRILQIEDVAKPSHSAPLTPCRPCRRRLHTPDGR